MNIRNIFQINDWDFRSFVVLVLTFQLMFDLTIVFNIDIIREIIGFLYLTFIPGVLILRILQFHEIGSIKTVLFSVGLSISTTYILGLILNTFLPIFRINDPISFQTLFLSLNISMIILTVISYFIDRGFSKPNSLDFEIFSPNLLLTLLIPFLSVIGCYIVLIYQNNISIIISLVLMIVLILLFVFNKIKSNLYPLVLFSISISLLFIFSLVSPNLFGSDIMFEKFTSDLVIINQYWNFNIDVITNSVISSSIFPAIYSILLGIDTSLVFKFIFPCIFALVPIALYSFYKKVTTENIAFISVIFIIGFNGFFLTSLYLPRQQIASFFFALLLLLFFESYEMKKSILIIIFLFSLIMSHYSLSYIFIFYLLLFLVFSYFLKTKNKIKSIKIENITITLLFFSLVLAVSWYLYMSKGEAFMAILKIGNHVYGSFFTELISPEARGVEISKFIGGSLISPLHELARDLYRITVLFIIVGFIGSIIKSLRLNFKLLNFLKSPMTVKKPYLILSLISIMILIATVVFPRFITGFNMDRMYFISLFILSPFCIIGGMTIIKWIDGILCIIKMKIATKEFSLNINPLKLITIFIIIPYFLFNVGFIYEVTDDPYPTSIALSFEKMKNSNDTNLKSSFYSQYTSLKDVSIANWILKNRNIKKIIYADENEVNILVGYGIVSEKNYFKKPFDQVYPLKSNLNIQKGSYIVLGTYNIEGNLIIGWLDGISNLSDINSLLKSKNKIYSNGGSEVWIS